MESCQYYIPETVLGLVIGAGLVCVVFGIIGVYVSYRPGTPFPGEYPPTQKDLMDFAVVSASAITVGFFMIVVGIIVKFVFPCIVAL